MKKKKQTPTFIDWGKYHIVLTKNDVAIGYGSQNKSGKVAIQNVSESKTFDAVNAVAIMMKNKMIKRDSGRTEKKHYFGYDLNETGKLVLIEPGYEFILREKGAPIQLRDLQ